MDVVYTTVFCMSLETWDCCMCYNIPGLCMVIRRQERKKEPFSSSKPIHIQGLEVSSLEPGGF
jgi:hypothetical protein